MTVPDNSPQRIYRAGSARVLSRAGTPAEETPSATAAPSTPGSWPWRQAALLACIAAQLITIADLVGADPIPATWTALLLAVAPAPLALTAAFLPARTARLAAPLTVVVLVTGIVGEITHTGLFFLPGLATMIVAALRLWRE